jgi:3-deoxy-D-manno-octulosonic-acid transferase
METELWPNIIHYSYGAGVPVMLANARLSERSAKGYGKVARLTRSMLSQLTLVAAQHQTDAGRFQALGLPKERVEATGSIKLDISIDEGVKKQAAELKTQLNRAGERFIWVAASTHDGEDEKLLAVHQRLLQQQPDALLILVPRHPERFSNVAQQCSEQFRIIRRSRGDCLDKNTQVLLGDTMGELLLLYGCADVAFVGGSLIAHGGHNMLEPAAWGLPVLTGKHNFNFEKIAAALEAVGGMKSVVSEEQLGEELLGLASQPTRRAAMGAAARSYVASNRGALQRLLALIDSQLGA